MTFVTSIRLTSGDRQVLDEVVEDIKQAASRKGVEFKGPHPSPPEEHSVGQSKRLDDGETFRNWKYTVYARTFRIVGHDEFASATAKREFPDGIHVEVDIEQVRGMGRT